jgi:hypothetical protein
MIRKKSINIWLVLSVAALLTLPLLNGCKKGTIDTSATVVLQLSQDSWSLQYSGSQGEVEVFLRGEGASDIDLGSIEMKGDNTGSAPLKPSFAENRGDHVLARFAKNLILQLLSSPSVGSTHTVTVTFYMTSDQVRKEIRATVTITNEKDDDEGSESSGFTLELDPEEWSLNFIKSQGTVEAFIKGDDFDKIDLDSFKLKGDNDEEAISALSASRQGDHVHARFPKNLLIDLLLDPEEGSTHTITVIFENNETDVEVELTFDITIEEDDDSSEEPPVDISLEIDPDEWSLNFDKSSGLVKAFIYGEDLEDYDLNSIQMKGDDDTATPLISDSADINGDHMQARFPKNQVIGLLLDPEEGSTHTITIILTNTETGETIELTAEITIEEDDDEEEEEETTPGDLSLEIKPSTWNMNYNSSSGVVKAFIKGDDIADIDLDDIKLKGDNESAGELEASSASRQGNHVQIDFPKNEVLAYLDNPAPGSSHTVTVIFELNGEEVELSAIITIVGSNE